MQLYMWKSELLANYGKGRIIVMAMSVEDARKKVLQEWKPLIKDNDTEDPYLIMLDDMEDEEEFLSEHDHQRNILVHDISDQPTIVGSGVMFVHGSD